MSQVALRHLSGAPLTLLCAEPSSRMPSANPHGGGAFPELGLIVNYHQTLTLPHYPQNPRSAHQRARQLGKVVEQSRNSATFLETNITHTLTPQR